MSTFNEENSVIDREKAQDAAMDLRAFPRIPLDAELTYQILRDHRNRTCAHTPQSGRALDASAGGLKLLSEDLLPINSIVEIKVDLYNNHAPQRFCGQVVRSAYARERGFFESGLQFSNITHDERLDLHIQLKRLRNAPSRADASMPVRSSRTLDFLYARFPFLEEIFRR